MKELLKVENLVGRYQAENGEVTAVKDLSFTVKEGQFISIVGPSGCGKSTLLSIIAGLAPPSGGRVLVGGEDYSGRRCPRIGYMLQRDDLLEWRSIYRNVLLGLEIRRELTEENIAYAGELLRTYGLWEFRNKYPSQLSGGMRQRAALIRTLAVRPEILLLDEAFSALDYQTRLAVTDDVYRILKREKKTALLVTHDIPESISMADRVLVLTPRPASVKLDLEIRFDGLAERTPLLCREHPRFGGYFNMIWRELDAYAA